jgi:hypothetical protein
MPRRCGGIRRAWLTILAGLAWAQVCIALQLFVVPKLIRLGESVAEGPWYRLASWTLLAPSTLAWRVVAEPASSEAASTAASPIGLVMCPLLAVGMCLAAGRLLGSPTWRGAAITCLTGVALLGLAGAMAVALQCRDAVEAQRSFFAMVSRAEIPHKDASTVLAAREFVRRYPDSRWAGEALRIQAMAEWDEGHVAAASALWGRFGERFHDRDAPGVAYAEYSIALCDERLGDHAAARRHLRKAIEIIRVRSDGIQEWILPDAAARLSSLEGSDGRYALADYWKTKSRTFAQRPTE